MPPLSTEATERFRAARDFLDEAQKGGVRHLRRELRVPRGLHGAGDAFPAHDV